MAQFGSVLDLGLSRRRFESFYPENYVFSSKGRTWVSKIQSRGFKSYKT